MKKILALIMALALVMGLAVTASAASITITPGTVPEGGDVENVTYTAYKLLDANITTTGVTYTLPTSETVKKEALEDTGLFAFVEDPILAVWHVTAAEDYDDADDLADKLDVADLGTAYPLAYSDADGGKYSVTVDPGYYLVVSSLGERIVVQTAGDVNIEQKNSYPSIALAADLETADAGDPVVFTVTVTIPETASGAMTIANTLTGLTYDSFAAGTTGVTTTGGTTFTLPATTVEANKGGTVTFTFTADMVGGDTAAVAKASVVLTAGGFETKPAEDTVLTTDIVINKHDAKTTSTKLSGATFVLTKKGGEATKYYALNGTDVDWVADIDDATPVTTDAAGAATFHNLANGNYELVETVAPTGYNLLATPTAVPVTAQEADGDVTDVTVNVPNSAGSELPSTGGIGTTLFYVIGALMMTGAAVLMITKKRMSV